MTGMPAFGLTHEDGTLWSIVAFVRELPDLQPEAYTARCTPVRRRNTRLKSNQWEDTSTSAGAVALGCIGDTSRNTESKG